MTRPALRVPARMPGRPIPRRREPPTRVLRWRALRKEARKRLFDVVTSSIALLLLSPLLILAWLCAPKTTHGGTHRGALRRENRFGLHGRHFVMYSFQTTPRAGRLLRATGIDTLPQLFNVLRGDMSLVGPRPARRGEAELFEGPYRRRFRVRPGLSGPWRLTHRHFLTTRQRLDMDIEYIDQCTFFLDLKTLGRTVGAFLTGRAEP